MIRIFLDDERDVKNIYPDNYTGWIVCSNVEKAKRLILNNPDEKFIISFDHDLGEKQSGYDLAKWIEERVINREMIMPQWYIHSANPKGWEYIEMAMRSAERNIE